MGFFGRPLRPSPADHVLYLRSPGSRHSSPLLSSLSSLHAHTVHHKVYTKNFCALSCGCLFRAPGRIHTVRRGPWGHSEWGGPWPGIPAEPVYGDGRPTGVCPEIRPSRQRGRLGVPESSLLGSLTAHTPRFRRPGARRTMWQFSPTGQMLPPQVPGRLAVAPGNRKVLILGREKRPTPRRLDSRTCCRTKKPPTPSGAGVARGALAKPTP